MSEILTQIKETQDKTTLKGVYLFLSIVIALILFKYTLGINIIIYLTNESLLNLSISTLSLATIITAALYYTQLNLIFLENLFKMSKLKKGYPNYKEINLSNSIQHPFIYEDRTKFGAKLFFSISLGLSILLFLGENILLFIIISLFLVVLAFFLLILMKEDWKNLKIHIKMIYFMKLFIQENNLYRNSPDNIVQEFISYVQKNLWFEAKASFSYFLNEISELAEPYQKKIKYSKIIQKFYDFIFDAFDLKNLKNKPHHEFTTAFFNHMKLDISKKTPRKDRYTLDYINPIIESFKYVEKFITRINSWDLWLKKFIFESYHIELSKFLTQVKQILFDFNENNHYVELKSKQKMINRRDLDISTIKQYKKEIYTKYQAIIRNFIDQHHVLQLKNIVGFFKKDMMKKYLNKIREKRFFLDLELGTRERLTEDKYQNVFSALIMILKFYIKNYSQYPFNYQNGKIFHYIEILQKYEYDLYKIGIEMDFSQPYQFSIKIASNLDLMITFEQEGLFNKKVKELKIDKEKLELKTQKEKIHQFLKLRSKKYNLIIENKEFWEEINQD